LALNGFVRVQIKNIKKYQICRLTRVPAKAVPAIGWMWWPHHWQM